MAESTQAFTYRDVVLTLAGGGGNVTYSTSTGALHGSGVEYTLVGEPGDISITLGGSAMVRVNDRGVFDQLRLGDEEPSEISGSAQFRDMLDGSADTLVAWLTSLRDGSANNKNANVPESTSVSTASADDAEVMSAALKLVWTNAGNAADTAAIAWNIVTCSAFSIAESAGDVTKVNFTFVAHDAPSNVYQA